MNVEDFGKYLQQLRDPDEVTRIAAYKEIKYILNEAKESGRVNQFCVPQIVDTLIEISGRKDFVGVGDISLGKIAINLLDTLGATQAVVPLIACLKHEYREIREATAKALFHLGASAVDPLIDCLDEESPYIRAKAAELLHQLGDYKALSPLTKCLKSKAYWVREVVKNVLEDLMMSDPKASFQFMSQTFFREFDAFTLKNPETGSEFEEYLLRLLFTLYLKHIEELARDFSSFMEKLKVVYKNYKDIDSDGSKKIQRILRFFLSIIRLDEWMWSEETKILFTFPERPHNCWTCAHYTPYSVPQPELTTFLQSKEYELFCQRYEWYIEHPDGSVTGPIDEKTGMFSKEAEKKWNVYSIGYCTRLHKLVEAGDTSKYYAPRELISPIPSVLISLGGGVFEEWFLVAELDSVMFDQFDKWITSLKRKKYYDEEPYEIAKCFSRFMMGNALSCEKIEQEFLSANSGSPIYFKKIAYMDKLEDWEIIQEFKQGKSWVIQGHCRAEDSILHILDLEQILSASQILCREDLYPSHSVGYRW